MRKSTDHFFWDSRKNEKYITNLLWPIMTLKETIINQSGYFGDFGGAYIPELLNPLMEEISWAFFRFKDDPNFLQDLHVLYREYIGRPSPLVSCDRLSQHLGGARLFVKNEWINHTWAHKINHCVGQALLAKYLGKTRIIAETGAWQHGIATASICARMGIECVIYMGAKDYDRQRPNVYAMELTWAKVIPVHTGSATLRSAITAALQDLIAHADESYYLLGTACGPAPYPSMNVFFQKIIGEEVRLQFQEKMGTNPDILIACVGGGSNSLGLFYDFLDDTNTRLMWVEAWWRWIDTGEHAARFADGKTGVTQWFKSIFLQTTEWHIRETSSISAGLDYAGVSPQIAYLQSINRLEMFSATDHEALEAVQILMQYEWILPALESAHAVAHAIKILPTLPNNTNVVINLSGRGEKDLFITAPYFDAKFIPYLHAYVQSYDDTSRSRISR